MANRAPLKFYNKCMYKDCVNGRVAHKKHIYRFPLQTDVRHNLWIRNNGKFIYIHKYWVGTKVRSVFLA